MSDVVLFQIALGVGLLPLAPRDFQRQERGGLTGPGRQLHGDLQSAGRENHGQEDWRSQGSVRREKQPGLPSAETERADEKRNFRRGISSIL